jgi:nicotinamidase-related amidase
MPGRRLTMVQDRQTDNKFSGVMKSLPEFEPDPKDTAVIIVDMQYLDAHRDYGIGAEAKALGTTEDFDYFFTRIEDLLIPNIQKVQQACRERGIEVIFLKIASLVDDCRDVSSVHKRLQLLAPAKSKEAEILEEIKPLDNEIVVIKGCSGAFNGTNLDQILANLGMKTLIFCGVATNYCVETSVRDAGDRDYNVILLHDASAGFTHDQDQMAFQVLNETYAKVKSTDQVLEQINRIAKKPVAAGV